MLYKFPKNQPFIALLSYDTPEQNIIAHPKDAKKFGIEFKLNVKNSSPINHFIKKYPIDFDTYKKSFDKVINHQKNGDSYLLNLCFSTKIETNLSLKDIFEHTKGEAIIYKKDDFVCFTPEPFVTIKDGFIHTFPMKGTINAALPKAKEMLLNDPKEFSESAMMLDLMRNDLGAISTEVKVESFRYIQKVAQLYQTSSHISAKLKKGISFDEIFSSLLPAGSITGTPKHETMRIIKECEREPRGFYTGVFIYFDGVVCQSFVMIRFVKQHSDGLYFFSGGGITVMSEAKKEYDELIQKVYFPF
ncbi:aminodeoxychorismate synthase component I [Campylobacter sp.]|uniref:aminodeoxychorismate synthase component I n=1 Tax=Campylobacter sp. TaxID=205 RepID=UPI002AA8F476|nr:aminodeoxychorismate synthase component I [Campylobacter sp.]MCI6661859.1 aminodeoxychorismate synthase component I [Campylobacter sp.]